ncbi:hypothetical protein NC651_028202 [Populus alba x Populus x berolinensis]|nr:hypothetical protein NC651_028202 [Populus alba x Populus x berolinensis]
MDGYPPAQHSASGGFSLAAKGGLAAGVLFMLFFGTGVYVVFFKYRKGPVGFEVDVEMPGRSVPARN